MTFLRWFFRITIRTIAGLSVLSLCLLVLFNWPVHTKNEHMLFGVSFSNVFARDIGLDWKSTYTAILDDLGVQRIRIAAYWTEIETSTGQYDFSDLDWQLEEAKKRNVKVILAYGVKVPRWPECFIPEFYKRDKQQREDALLAFEEQLLKRYSAHPSITIWQIENEPFLPFGDCLDGAVSASLLDREIVLNRNLGGSRPIMVTDSGELSLWFPAAIRSDIFGTTLYRIVHKPPIGYITYPLGPNFFRVKGWLIKMFAFRDFIIISELQGEPWGPSWIPNMSVEEQYKSMNPEKFTEIIEYAKKTGFSESYLWGAEWWWWLKTTQNRPEMWDAAKQVLK